MNHFETSEADTIAFDAWIHLMAKTLKSFPPASKPRQVRVGGSLAEIDPPQKSNRGFRELHEFTK
jgi:hypothetical protein